MREVLMKKLIVLLSSLGLLSLPLAGCGSESKGGDDPIVVPDSGPAIVTDDAGTDAGPQDASEMGDDDAGDDAGVQPAPDASENDDAGEQPDSGHCVPRSEEDAMESACGTGALNAPCGPKTVADGCGGTMDITCGCSGDLKCESESKLCVEECVPLTPNTGNAYYCNHAPNFWECGGKIERDDLCGGRVMVNCGGDTACKGGKVCDTDPSSESYLHCVFEDCVPQDETDQEFCTRYHSECGTADGEDSCNSVKHVDCGSCAGTKICVSQMASGGYVERSCEEKPTAVDLEACTETEGDTSSSDASSVMLVEKNGSYLYSAPEVVYAFKASAAGDVTVTAKPYESEGTSTYDLVLYVVDDLASRTPIKLSNNGITSEGKTEGAPESLTFPAIAGKTYYLVVDGADWSSQKYDRGPFHITVDDGSCSPTENPYDGKVVISALYTGGGSSSYPIWFQDYIELHNQGSKDIDLTNWTVFVSPVDSSSNWQPKATIGRATIKAGGYFLIGQVSPKGDKATVQDIPTPDKATGKVTANTMQLGEAHKILIGMPKGTTEMTETDGVLKPNGSDALTSNDLKNIACPTDKGILITFGSTGTCGSSLPALPNATSALPYLGYVFYSEDGCAEITDRTELIVTTREVIDDEASQQKHTEITAIAPVPRSSGTTPKQCGD